MPTLEKCSTPGWVKEVASPEVAAAELLPHICGECLAGEIRVVGSGTPVAIPRPDPSNLEHLLATPCGLEFEFTPHRANLAHTESTLGDKGERRGECKLSRRL